MQIKHPLNVTWWKTTVHIYAAPPELECLTFRPASRDGNRLQLGLIESRTFPCVANLWILKVEKVVNEFVELITHLIETSPYLGRAILWMSYGQQRKVWWAGIVEAPRRYEKLWRLMLRRRNDFKWEKGGFENLRNLDLKREYDGCWALLLDGSASFPSNPTQS